MPSPYCDKCGFQPPDPVAANERTAILASAHDAVHAAHEEIRRLRKLAHRAYVEGRMDQGCETVGGLPTGYSATWEESVCRKELGPDVARPG